MMGSLLGNRRGLKTSRRWLYLSLNLRSRSSTTLLPISTNHEPPWLFSINLFSQVGSIDYKTALLGMSLAASQSNGIIFHTGNSEGPALTLPSPCIWLLTSTSQPCFLVRRCNLIFIINFIHIKYFYYLKKYFFIFNII